MDIEADSIGPTVDDLADKLWDLSGPESASLCPACLKVVQRAYSTVAAKMLLNPTPEDKEWRFVLVDKEGE